MNIHLKFIKNIILNITLNIIIIFTIASCGGGEEQSSSTPVLETPPPPPVTITTSDLVSKADFDLLSSADLDITLPSAPSKSVNYFINICTDFSVNNSAVNSSSVNINYDSCKLRTTLITQEQVFSLSLSAAESMIVAQIWPIEAGAQPITLFWDITESGNIWKIAI